MASTKFSTDAVSVYESLLGPVEGTAMCCFVIHVYTNEIIGNPLTLMILTAKRRILNSEVSSLKQSLTSSPSYKAFYISVLA